MSSSPSLKQRLADAPEDFGLLMTLDCTTDKCQLEFVPDQHMEMIHPNAYGPLALTDLERLGGGGSGVRVFRGNHPQLGPLVMKHGGYKDTKELFALATIAKEMQRRHSDARADMNWRLPEYRMLYISPCHLRETPSELWAVVSKALGSIISSMSSGDRSSHSTLSLHSIASGSSSGSGGTKKEDKTKDIRLFTSCSDDKVHVLLNKLRLKIVLGSDDRVTEDGDLYLSLEYGAPGEGYSSLHALLDKLVPLQSRRLWKFTQAQKSIGGPSVKTGVSYLARGELCGDILQTLIQEYVQVIRNLQKLTLPDEEEGVEEVRRQAKVIEEDVYMRPCDVSDEVDAFVAFSIKKNFHPEKGRFFRLRFMGEDFRKKALTLTKAEKLPCRLLGIILKPESRMNSVFADATEMYTALDTKGFKVDTWRMLIHDAVSLKCSAAQKLVWSCGIADGGLHNVFLSSERMWLFDLGEPTLQPLPAFLTKFLFSFFHGLGMVDDKVNGGWDNRFVPTGKKVCLSDESKELTEKAYAAFKVTLDHMIAVLFDGEEAVRGLLINYVTLQLLSDAGFCLERWVIKGGGKARTGNHQKHLEQWLWRALWDIYIASDLNTRKRLLYVGAKVSYPSAHSCHGPAM